MQREKEREREREREILGPSSVVDGLATFCLRLSDFMQTRRASHPSQENHGGTTTSHTPMINSVLARYSWQSRAPSLSAPATTAPTFASGSTTTAMAPKTQKGKDGKGMSTSRAVSKAAPDKASPTARHRFLACWPHHRSRSRPSGVCGAAATALAVSAGVVAVREFHGVLQGATKATAVLSKKVGYGDGVPVSFIAISTSNFLALGVGEK